MNETAEWIRRTHALWSDEYECSACEARTDAPYERCPFCGAKMEGELYDPSWVEEMAFFNEIMKIDDEDLF